MFAGKGAEFGTPSQKVDDCPVTVLLHNNCPSEPTSCYSLLGTDVLSWADAPPIMWPFSSSDQRRLNAEGFQQFKPPPQSVETSEQHNAQELVEANIRQQWETNSDERLGLSPVTRGKLLLGAAALTGFSLGGAKGGPIAADRYRAENAHRQPTTKSGWYLYYKSKNYHSLVGSAKEGAKFGSVLMGWAALFAITEEVIDRSRARVFARTEDEDERVAGQRDAASTVMAALTVAGVYSWKSGFDQFAAGRMARVALKYSLAFGLAQDALAVLRGSQPAYVDWIKKKVSQSPRTIGAV